MQPVAVPAAWQVCVCILSCPGKYVAQGVDLFGRVVAVPTSVREDLGKASILVAARICRFSDSAKLSANAPMSAVPTPRLRFMPRSVIHCPQALVRALYDFDGIKPI